MLHNVSPNDLHVLGYGKHMDIMEEGNDSEKFQWTNASVVIQGPYTVVLQEAFINQSQRGDLFVATYRTHEESYLMSLRVYSMTDPFGREYYRTG